MWNGPNGIVNVAVKRLAAGAAKANRVKLLQEAAIMGQFLHPNVIQLFGIVVRQDTVRGSIVMFYTMSSASCAGY